MVWNSRRDSSKRLCLTHVTVKNSLGFTLQDCNRVMEHTRFLLLTRSTSVEGCCLRIEREARKIAECTSYTPCVLLSFSSSFPTHVLPVLSVRKRLCILCVPPKFHNLPSRGNIIPFGEISLRNILLKTDNFRFLCQKTRQISLRILAIKMRSHFYRRK